MCCLRAALTLTIEAPTVCLDWRSGHYLLALCLLKNILVVMVPLDLDAPYVIHVLPVTSFPPHRQPPTRLPSTCSSLGLGGWL